MFDYNGYIDEALSSLKKSSRYRALTRVDAPDPTHLRVEGKTYLNCSSNNYCSLSHSPALIEASKEAASRYGVAGAASRYVAGNGELYDALEERIARFKGFERAFVFSSGFAANLGAIGALMEKGDIAFVDKHSHASIIDAVRLSGAEMKTFPHRGYARLEALLAERRTAYRKAFVITESVFSMDGDVADLNELVRIKNAHNALLIVDEAHATGVFGARGSGCIELRGICGVDIETGSLSKAIPSVGGYALAKKNVIEYIVNRARSAIFTTALPPSTLAVSLAAIDRIEALSKEREAFCARVASFRDRLRAMGYETFQSESHIVPVRTGENEQTLSVAQRLREAGVFAVGIRPPTVANGEGRIRLSFGFGHTEEDFETVYTALTNAF